MTIPWGQIALLAAEALLVASLLLFLFRRRVEIGLAPLYLALGCLQPLQVLLASALYLEIWPGILVSPGSSVLFPATLLAVLLVYIREDASEARRLTYGLLTANIVASALLFVSGLQTESPAATALFELPRELFSQNVRVMLVGTIVLFLDALLIIIVYERLSRYLARVQLLHVLASFALVLAFDTVAFSFGAFIERGPIWPLLVSGLVGKTLMAIPYSAALVYYLTWRAPPERPSADGSDFGSGTGRFDPFSRFSFRQRYEAAHERSLRDPLTGLHNRGFFDEILPMTLERSRRSGSQVTLLIIDLEGFKAINDTHGHIAGDETLRQFAAMLRGSARAEDVLCRYGGDEFAVVIRQDAGKEAATPLVHRLQAETRTWKIEKSGRVFSMPGFTVGTATSPADGTTAEELLEAADQRLYAKRRAERVG